MSNFQCSADVKDGPAVSQSPSVRPWPGVIERDAQLRRLADGIAPMLFAARHFHYGGNGIGATWETASEADRRDCRRLAEEAVAAASEFREQDAVRVARLNLQDLIRKAEFEALQPDIDHSCRHLISDALGRMRTMLNLCNPAQLIVWSYRGRLRGEYPR